jgi:hypothetical protein
MSLVTFHKWVLGKESDLVSINPDEVSDIEDYCGNVTPGSLITLKNKKQYVIFGNHEWIVAVIEAAKVKK